MATSLMNVLRKTTVAVNNLNLGQSVFHTKLSSTFRELEI